MSAFLPDSLAFIAASLLFLCVGVFLMVFGIRAYRAHKDGFDFVHRPLLTNTALGDPNNRSFLDYTCPNCSAAFPLPSRPSAGYFQEMANGLHCPQCEAPLALRAPGGVWIMRAMIMGAGMSFLFAKPIPEVAAVCIIGGTIVLTLTESLIAKRFERLVRNPSRRRYIDQVHRSPYFALGLFGGVATLLAALAGLI